MEKARMVKKGYKQTEVGLIPEEWSVQSFEDTFRILNNNTFSRAELNYVSGKFRNIHYGDVLIRFPEVLDCTRGDVPYINDEARISGVAQVLQNGDIVMADTAEDETVGKVTEVMNISEKPVLSGLHTIPCRVKEGEFVPKWLGYYMNSHLYHDQLLPYIHGIKVSSVSKSSLGRTAIIVPTTEEQERIVEALSDIDALMDNLKKLIEKKKKIKQGTMQELLTGKKRLPGFVNKGFKQTEVGIVPEDWNDIRLEKICLPNGIVRGPFGGALKKEVFVKQGYKVYEQGNAINHTINYGNYYIDVSKYNEMKRFQLKSGDFIISCSGTIGKIFKIPENSPKGIINQALLKLSIDEKIIDSDFFLYYFSWENFNKNIIDDTQGGAIKNLVGMNVFRNVVLSIPKLKEQTAIANLLSDMDEEITTLDKKLAKTKAFKQGMMQKLLTGEIRLV